MRVTEATEDFLPPRLAGRLRTGRRLDIFLLRKAEIVVIYLFFFFLFKLLNVDRLKMKEGEWAHATLFSFLRLVFS